MPGMSLTTIGMALGMFGGAGAGEVTLAHDTFTDDDGTGLTNHTPDVDAVGSGWIEIRQQTTTPDSLDGWIIGNQLRLRTDAIGNALETNAADVDVTVEWTPAVGQANRNSIVLRYSSNGNMWLANVREDNGDVRIQSIQADSIATHATESFAFTEGTTYTIRATAVGDTITVYVNGDQVVQYTSASFNNTATIHGLIRSVGSNETLFDNFVIKTT